jgi:predicted phosphodiesterase
MKYDICSDLHIEHSGIPNWSALKNSDSDALVIAGDISNDYRLTLKIIKDASEIYPEVIWLDGNHDHYMWNGTVTELMDFFTDQCSKMQNVTYLHGNNYQRFGDIVFIGASGWYDFNAFPKRYTVDICRKAWRARIADSRWVDFGGFWNPDDVARDHAYKLTKLIELFTDDEMISSIIVVTHSIPSSQLVRITGDDDWDRLTGSYVNSVMCDVIHADRNNKIKVWNYGHTHEKSYKYIDDILFINNSRGYAHEGSNNWFLAQVDTDSIEPWR